MKQGKRYIQAQKLVDASKAYEPQDAMKVVVDTATAKFDESIELHVRLGVDSRHADQQVRGVVVLPHGTGKTQRVLVIAKGAKADEATAAGADYVGGEEYINKIKNENWFDFDVCVTTPDPAAKARNTGSAETICSASRIVTKAPMGSTMPDSAP